MNKNGMEKFSGFDVKKLAAWLFCLICAAIGVYLIFKYAFAILLPFLIALFFALITDRPSSYLEKKTGISKRFFSVILLITIISVTTLLLFLGINRLIFEGERLLSKISDDSGRLGNTIASLFDRISSFGDKQSPLLENLMKIDAFREFWINIDKTVATVISDTVSSLTRSIPMLVFSIMKSLPNFLIFIIVTLIASFYFCLDYDRIKLAVISVLPKRLSEFLPRLQKRISSTAIKYVRAYLLLLLLTFCQLFVGFSILRTPYPLLLAILVALVDFLPILGVGTVLIPWGLSELIFSKDYYQGIGLLIIYLIVIIVRQITEPKIVAGSLGLHPLITLIAMYAGLKVFGIFGMIVGPVIALAIKSLLYSVAKSND